VESGVAGVDLQQWIYMLAPAKTNKEIISRLYSSLLKELTTPDIKDKLQSAGFDAARNTPQQLDTMIRDALAYWGKLIPELNIKPE
jgi:tripartite-type tricarboxylate transporter receptor subunit TctC